MGSEIRWNSTSARNILGIAFSNYLIPRNFCLDWFQNFPNSFRHIKKNRGKYKDLIMEISTLVKTALYSYFYMLPSLVLPCLPNHEVVYTTFSSASVCIEAEWRLSVNDHQYHCRHHHHHHHYHHRYCPVCFDVIFLLRSWLWRQLSRLLN